MKDKVKTGKMSHFPNIDLIWSKNVAKNVQVIDMNSTDRCAKFQEKIKSFGVTNYQKMSFGNCQNKTYGVR